MSAPSFLITLHQHRIRRIQKQNFGTQGVIILHILQRLGQGLKELSAPEINHKGHTADFAVGLLDQLGKFGYQDRRQVIYAKETQVLHALHGNGFAGA
ncbi:hypothetical protein D3C75_994520 [compost metagenome]